eukprot:5575177-Pleurochrysis_carterae.AAC.1
MFCVSHARAQCVPPPRRLYFTACRACHGCSEPCLCPVVSVPPSKLACVPYVCGLPHMRAGGEVTEWRAPVRRPRELCNAPC